MAMRLSSNWGNQKSCLSSRGKPKIFPYKPKRSWYAFASGLFCNIIDLISSVMRLKPSTISGLPQLPHGWFNRLAVILVCGSCSFASFACTGTSHMQWFPASAMYYIHLNLYWCAYHEAEMQTYMLPILESAEGKSSGTILSFWTWKIIFFLLERLGITHLLS